MTDEERRKEEKIKRNALYCNMYRYIHHLPIDQIVEATALAAYTQNPDCSAEVFEREQKAAFQELMLDELTKWGAPMEALEKSNLLPEAGQQKYLTEVNKRIQDSKVHELNKPKNITE